MIAGTRGSALALWQTNHVVGRMGVPVTIETLVTRGDVDRTSRLQGKLEKGFFTAELEAALREKRIDFAGALAQRPAHRGCPTISSWPRCSSRRRAE